MRNFMEAYAAVHKTEAKEELTSGRDSISEMNLSVLTDTDLTEIVESVLEVMFQNGHSVDSAHKIFSEMFEVSNIAGRQVKIDRLCEALNKAFDVIDSKAASIALEEFAKYRHNKKLQESWSARFNQEKRVERTHNQLVAQEALNVKNLLLQLVEKKAKKDYDGDGEIESGTDEYMGSRDKAIKKAMGKGKCEKCGGKGCSHCDTMKEDSDPCWDSHKMVGMKKKGGKMVPNCVSKGKIRKEEFEDVEEGYGTGAAMIRGGGKPKKKVDVFAYDRRLQAQGKLKGKKLPPAPTSEEVENVEELYKGKHGQSEKEYMDSRSDAGKQISGDSKMSGAAYSHRSFKGQGKPAKPGGRQKHQGKMTPADRNELAIRKRALKKEEVKFSERELKAFEEIVNSWED